MSWLMGKRQATLDYKNGSFSMTDVYPCVCPKSFAINGPNVFPGRFVADRASKLGGERP